jgi:dihydrofolate synthase/folylpolyglutamate synthase
MALRYFSRQKVDLVIWETGLGGRLDATNIVTPLASVITNVQYDHQKYLGETLTSIAGEKAGIIKPGVPVITGSESPEALAVIRNTALAAAARLTVVRPDETHQPLLEGIRFPLLGEHQRMNAAVAVASVRALAPQIAVADETIRIGLECVDWPGRLQLITLASGQKLLLDGAHNIGGANTLATALKSYFPSTKPALILGVLRDKDWAAMCEILAPLANRILLVPVHSERSAEPHGLAEVCTCANPNAQVAEFHSFSDAWKEVADEDFVIVAGSLYLIGEAMELLGLSSVKLVSERALNEWGEARHGNAAHQPERSA